MKIARCSLNSLSQTESTLHRSWKVLYSASTISAELVYENPHWAANTGATMRWNSSEKVIYELMLPFPALHVLFVLVDGL